MLLVGGIGAGKTTTGLSLLNAGWQLLSNDSPVVVGTAVFNATPVFWRRIQNHLPILVRWLIWGGRGDGKRPS